MRVVFLGTPAAAVPPLRALVDAGHDVALVVTRADKRRGRGASVAPSPVKQAALELGLRIGHRVDDVLDVAADLGVVVAFGELIKPHVLEVLPMVNLHFSLLPRWRGAAPVERAIIAGDSETGVCVMAVEEGLDTGGVYATARVPIGSADTAASLRDRLVDRGTDLLVATLSRPLPVPTPQRGTPTYAAKLTTEDLHMDWTQTAEALARLPRVGKAWTTFRGRRLLVLAAVASATAVEGPPGTMVGTIVATGDGSLELQQVQPEGRAALDAQAWRNGARPHPGELLGG
ncbi:MAG: methionyl-tRNA formyltransferase [Acidimicrobiales bacterium]